MRTSSFVLCFTLLCLFLSGCSDKVSVSGKVTLPDGSPATRGQILFEKEGFVGWGEIQKDGTYRMGTIKSGDGIPRGDYGVYFTGVMKDTSQTIQGQNTSKIGSTPASLSMPIPLLDKKYDSAKTSGLTCSVTKSTVYNVTVDPRE